MNLQQILTNVMPLIAVGKSTNTFDLFFTTISTNKEIFFFSERELIMTSRDTLTAAALSELSLLSITAN